MTSRPVAARASRSAAWTISVPELPKRTRSAHGDRAREPFGELDLRDGLPGEQLPATGLLLDGADDRSGSVAEDPRAHAEHVVHVVVAVDVDEVRARGMVEEQRDRVATGTEVAADAAGERLVRPLERRRGRGVASAGGRLGGGGVGAHRVGVKLSRHVHSWLRRSPVAESLRSTVVFTLDRFV